MRSNPAENPAPKRLILARPRGFCAGVRHAVDMMTAALRVYPPPIYCLKEIVHNRQVIDGLRNRGVVFVDALDAVPAGGTLFFSAHGVSPAVRADAERRGFRILDATCPFVEKVHRGVRRYAQAGYTIFLVGHHHHDEVIGVAGEAPRHVKVIESDDDAAGVDVPDPQRVAVVTQTTLSVEQTRQTLACLRRRFPAIETPAKRDICYATSNRQQAVRELAKRVSQIVVLGSRNSSNTNRLVEVAKAAGSHAVLVSALHELDALSLETMQGLGLTAGASTPDDFIEQVIDALQKAGFSRVEEIVVPEEEIHFHLPRELREETT